MTSRSPRSGAAVAQGTVIFLAAFGMTGPFRGSAAENDRPSRNDGRALIDHAWFHRGSVVVRGAGPAAPAAWGSGPLDAPRFRAADVGSRLGPARRGIQAA